jgi:hypothetical protein
MTITHNQIVSLLEDIANNHYQINGFGFGEPWEYLASDTKKTPCLWGILNGSNRNNKELTLNYTLLVFDQVKKDESNENNVLSDTYRILMDVVTILNSPTYATQFILGVSNTMQDFTERFDNAVSGWSVEVSFRIPFDNDICQIPSSGLPSLSNDYEVTIYDQNGDIVTLIPCGGSYSVIVASGIDEGNSTQTYTNQVVDI